MPQGGMGVKRVVFLVTAALLLTGCAAERDEARAEALQRRYGEMGGCDARVSVAVSRTDETLRYTMDVAHDAAGTRSTVVLPEELSGISAIVSGEGLKLSYDGIVLDALSSDPNVSAANAADIVLRAIASGWIAERGSGRFEDAEALRLCFETERGGETLRVAVWFDDADAPLYAEIESVGEIMAELEFTDFAFRGTILPDG